MAVTFPALLVKLVCTNPDSFFQLVEAGMQLAEERLPPFKAQERRELPATELLALTTMSLPRWQAPSYASHMILYKEKCDYKHGTVIWRQAAGK